MKIITTKIILMKNILGGYSAHYKEEKLHKFADNIEQVIYHGDISTRVDKNIIICPMTQNHLEVEYIEKAKRLVVSTY